MADYIVRELGTDKEVHRFEGGIDSKGAVRRTHIGWAHNANLDKYWLDTSEVEAAAQLREAAKEGIHEDRS